MRDWHQESSGFKALEATVAFGEGYMWLEGGIVDNELHDGLAHLAAVVTLCLKIGFVHLITVDEAWIRLEKNNAQRR